MGVGLGGLQARVGGCGGEVLTAGQAAHLTELGAGLVHEGAVQAGPHGGGGGGRRGAPHGPIVQGAGRLAPHRTWGERGDSEEGS